MATITFNVSGNYGLKGTFSTPATATMAFLKQEILKQWLLDVDRQRLFEGEGPNFPEDSELQDEHVFMEREQVDLTLMVRARPVGHPPFTVRLKFSPNIPSLEGKTFPYAKIEIEEETMTLMVFKMRIITRFLHDVRIYTDVVSPDNTLPLKLSCALGITNVTIPMVGANDEIGEVTHLSDFYLSEGSILYVSI